MIKKFMENKNNRRSFSLMLVLLVAMLAAPAMALAQQATAVAPASQPTTPVLPKLDVFAGYSYIDPMGSVAGHSFSSIVPGFIYGGDYFFDRRVHRHLGVIVEGGYHRSNPCDNCIYTLEAGPVVQSIKYGFNFSANTMIGGARVSGPNIPSIGGSTYYANPETMGFDWSIGGAADYPFKRYKDHLSIRVLELDYHYMHVNFGPQQATTGGIANINALQVSAGIVYRWNAVKKPTAR